MVQRAWEEIVMEYTVKTMRSRSRNSPYLNPDEASELFDVPMTQLLKLAESKYVPHLRLGKKVMFDFPVLKDWLQENQVIDNKGKDIPFTNVAYKLSEDILPDSKNVPLELSHLQGKLCQYNMHLFPPSVYFLVKDRRVVYVGQSVSFPSRVCSHVNLKVYEHTKKDKRMKFDTVLFIPCPKSKLKKVEREYLDKLLPEFNTDPITMMLKRKKVKSNEKI